MVNTDPEPYLTLSTSSVDTYNTAISSATMLLNSQVRTLYPLGFSKNAFQFLSLHTTIALKV